jgi:dUTP pyrophosphatase
LESITVKISRVGPDNDDLPLPRYMTEHAAGMDICAAVLHDTTVHVGERRLIPTGIAVAIPPGYEAQIRPRSGLALKYGITLLNAPGTIDADFRGEIGLIIINHGDQPFLIKRGERLAQMIISRVSHAKIEPVDTLESTSREDGGFGHTGI